MQSGNTEATLEVTLSAEYDNNIDLNSEIEGNDALRSDMMYHVIPAIDLTHFFNNHTVNFILKGDHRQGTGDALQSDTNIDTSLGVDFNFIGGLSIGLLDTYIKEAFDKRLYGESGVSNSQSNKYGINATYSLGQRTAAKASYSHLRKGFDEEQKTIEYDIDTVQTKFTVPVSESWEAYIAGYLKTIESEQVAIRDNDDIKGLIGARWSGPYRFAYWIEGGFEDIDYATQGEEDYSEAIGETGITISFTPRSSMEFSVGRNGYGKAQFGGQIRHNYDDKLKITLSANQTTARSYTSTSTASTYDLTSFKLSLNTTFMERVEAGLTGSYQIQDTTESVESLFGKATLAYPIQDWIKVGTHYQYCTRTSGNAKEEYDNNRIGLFVTLSI